MRKAGTGICLALLVIARSVLAYDQGTINPDDPSDGGRWLTVGSFTLPNTHQFLVQLDLGSIQKEDGFTTYWTRTWDVHARHPAMYFGQEELSKRAFDCLSRKAAVEALQSPFGVTALNKLTWKDAERDVTFDLVCGKSEKIKALDLSRGLGT